MPASLIAIYAIAALGILLGFAALIMQKIYLDSTTSMPTSVELPALGKITTNYPAVLFLAAGAGLAFYAFESSMTVKDDWTISGQLKVDDASLTAENRERLAHIKWDVGDITPIPSDIVNSQVHPNGSFEIVIQVPHGSTFEDAVQLLKFDRHPDVLGDLTPKTAAAEGKLLEYTANTRKYVFVVQAADQ